MHICILNSRIFLTIAQGSKIWRFPAKFGWYCDQFVGKHTKQWYMSLSFMLSFHKGCISNVLLLYTMHHYIYKPLLDNLGRVFLWDVFKDLWDLGYLSRW